MRDLINILNEAALSPSRNRDVTAAAIPGELASRDRAHELVSGSTSMAVPAGMMGDLAAIPGTDMVSDEQALDIAGYGDEVEHHSVNPDNLPAIVNSDIIRSGDDFHPTWVQIKHLPGYLQNSVRIIGREVFHNFTMTAIEDIFLLSTLLHQEDDVKKMMAWVKNNGHQIDSMTFDFSQYMRGYSAVVSVWAAGVLQYALVHDMMGYYIYAWPADDAQMTDLSFTNDD